MDLLGALLGVAIFVGIIFMIKGKNNDTNSGTNSGDVVSGGGGRIEETSTHESLK